MSERARRDGSKGLFALPWTVDDVESHKTGLTAKQKRQWVAVANAALERCQRERGDNCDARAIRQANSVVGAPGRSMTEAWLMAYSGENKSCYAYTPGDTKSDWKLPLCNESGNLDGNIVRAAAAALSPGGHRGNRVQLPANAIGGAKAKIRAAYHKVFPDMAPGDMPESIRLSEDDMFATRDDGEQPKVHVFQPTEFAEPPEWAPFLPTPGLYDHPKYGLMDFSPKTYERVLANFKSGIYNQRLPVTVEHDRYSSAVGYIEDMRLADDGRIEAKVNWTDRGQNLIRSDAFGYVSAELIPEWSPPGEHETVYKDVACGLTLTTRPYFKESLLPPLAASEAVLTMHAGKTGEESSMSEKDVTEEEVKEEETKEEEVKIEAQETPAVTQDEVKELTERIMTELTEQLGDRPKISDPIVQAFADKAAREVAALRLKASQSEKTATELTERNARLVEQYEVKFFTDEVMGRSDSNGTPWVGDVKDHVRMCRFLAEHAGRDSWELANYIQHNRGHAEQLKASHLFTEIGTGKAGEGLTVKDKAEFGIRQLMERDHALSYVQAARRFWEEHPDMYAQTLHED